MKLTFRLMNIFQSALFIIPIEEQNNMNAGNKSYTIKELESFCGIKAHTIRMWEKRYGILTPGRSETNIRSYTEDELKKILTISILNHNGIKISHIAKMTDEEILHDEKKKTAPEETSDGDFKPGPLIMSSLKFNETQFRKSLQPHIYEKGLEDAYIKVMYPLMQKSKTLWLTDGLSKAQEQFIEFNIRSLMIIHDHDLNISATKETVLIINISESDTYGTLIFMKYILKKRGFDVVYTGGTLTSNDIKGIQLIKPFSVLVLNVSPSTPDNEIKEISSSLIKQLKLRKLIITGKNNHVPGIKDNKAEIVCTPSEMAASANNL